MKKLWLLAAMLMPGIQLIFAGDDLKYPVSQVADSLKANAKVVIRDWDQTFEIKSVGKGILTVSYVYSILNENGIEKAVLIVPYSQKLHKVHSIRGAIYDAGGKKIENLLQEKVVDQSMIAGYSLYEDSRVKYFRPKTLTYPFTVEYSYVMEFDGLLDIPEWDPVTDYNVSVEKSKFTIIGSPGITFRYLEKNNTGKPEIVKNEAGTRYEWNISNLTAFVPEPFSGPHANFAPVVYIAPDNFELEGYAGNLATWEEFGKWGNEINKGRDQLSEVTVALIREKTKDCPTEIDKARVVYEYMQQKTRYLNITEGIGGWQTLPAETIDRLGYGDCKALTNYTMALLRAAGIKSYYAWVRAGDNTENVDPNFPINNFNHQILCIPTEKDTIWLECTSQHIPFGFIGDFTDDRKALVVTEEGGKLVNTRAYRKDENRFDRNVVLALGQTGDAALSVKTDYRGVKYDNRMPLLLAGTEDKKRMILDEINIPGTEILNFNYTEDRGQIPVLKENLELGILRYAALSGTRLLVPLVALNRQRDIPKKVASRRSDVIIRRSSVTVDSVTVLIPAGFVLESAPSEIKTESRFGSYSLKVTPNGDNKLLCIRRLELNKGTNPASTYNELVDFYKKIAVSDNTKISLKKS